MPNTTDRYVVTPTLAVAGAYTAGDVVGNVLTFEGAGVSGGILDTVVIFDDDAQGIEMDVVFFRAEPGAQTDNAAFALQTGDAANVLGHAKIESGDYIALGSGAKVGTTRDGMGQFGATPTGDLYARLITRGTPTYTNGGIRIEIGVTR